MSHRVVVSSITTRGISKGIRIGIGLGLLMSRPVLAAEPEEGARVQRLQRAAIRAAGVEEERFRGMRRRARAAALLPQVSATVGRGLVLTDTSKLLDGVATGTLRDSDQIHYSVTARWDLSRLIFAREELSLQAQAQRAAMLRTALVTEVARLYYERQKLLHEEGEVQEERIDQLTATLDGLTGLTGLGALGLPDGP